jgi:hypothetical protein
MADGDAPVECGPHRVNAEVCGGPHSWVYTDLGWELLRPNGQPVGTPCDPPEEYSTPPNIAIDEEQE